MGSRLTLGMYDWTSNDDLWFGKSARCLVIRMSVKEETKQKDLKRPTFGGRGAQSRLEGILSETESQPTKRETETAMYGGKCSHMRVINILVI